MKLSTYCRPEQLLDSLSDEFRNFRVFNGREPRRDFPDGSRQQPVRIMWPLAIKPILSHESIGGLAVLQERNAT